MGGRAGFRNLRLNILGDARLNGICVAGHVARAAATSGINGAFQGRGLKVGGVQFGRFRGVGDVACSSSAGRCHSSHCGQICWFQCVDGGCCARQLNP